MERARRLRLNEIMAALARHDAAALARLWAEFGDVLGRRMVAIARSHGHSVVPRHLVGDLVSDACLALLDVAPSWRPDGGALPWTWAQDRLGTCVDRVLGPPTLPFPDGERWAAPPPPIAYHGDEPPARLTLVALAGRNDTCRLLVDALDGALGLSRVDQEVFLRYV
ncbi:MAG: hypothetical protein ACRD29_08135 [Acidimicrobiales bacterium]